MANVITIDLQLKGLGGMMSGFTQAQKKIGSFAGSQSQITKQITGSTKGLRNYTTAAAKAYAQQVKLAQAQQKQYQAQVRQGWRMSGGNSIWGAGGSVLGKIIPEVGLVLAGMKALRSVFEGSAAEADSYRKSQYGAIGASKSQGAGYDISEKYSGVGAADWQRIHDAIRNGEAPYARAEVAGRGYNPRPGMYGDLNPAGTKDEVIKFLRDKNVAQGRKDRMMADLGTPGLRQFEDMSESDFKNQQDPVPWSRAGVENHNRAQASRWDRGWEAISSGADWKAKLVDAWDKVGDWFSKIPSTGTVPGMGSGNAINGAGSGVGRGAPDAVVKALNDLGNVLRENTTVMKGSSGGGRNAKNLPTAAWVRQTLQDSNDRQALQMGAYRL